MTLAQLAGEMRVLINNPPQNRVSDRDLMSFLIPSVQWLAGHLKFDIRTDNNIGLVAEQREYPLPPDLLYFVWVQVNGAILDPTTVWDLNSGGSTTTPNLAQSGQTWMTVPSGTPLRYAVQGRQLVLYPPASATFVATTPVMSWRYLSMGAWFTTDGSVGLTPQGIPSLTDLDLQVVRWEAAKNWLGSHMLGLPPDQVQSIQATIMEYEKSIAARLPECKRRWEDNLEDSHRTVRVDTAGRFVAAR